MRYRTGNPGPGRYKHIPRVHNGVLTMATRKTSIWNTHMKWREMRLLQKGVFLCKNVLNLAAFGFLFPNLWD